MRDRARRGMLCTVSMKRAVTGALVVMIAAAACSKNPSETPGLQAQDLSSLPGASFDPNEIVDLGSFVDTQSIPSAVVQQFLELTPYDKESFLATYSSNGVRAVDAIMAASVSYSLNPLVFLVAAEAAEGLVADIDYPIGSPADVEYVFGCGCASGHTDCDPSLAGFDVQVDCFGRALRASLSQVASQGQTAGGWGPSAEKATLDGVTVTPVDASTAALYQYTPYVKTNATGGNWMFWNLWQKYATAMNYAGGAPVPPTGAWIGDACSSNGTCSYTGGGCATNYPGGLCTASCTGTCPSDPSKVAAFCADFQSQGGFCLPVCNPSAPACRKGYACQQVAEFGDATQSAYACVPQGA